MSRKADVDFATFCELRDFTDEEMTGMEEAADRIVAFREGDRTGPTASAVLGAWDDDLKAHVRLLSGANLLAMEILPIIIRVRGRDSRGYSVNYIKGNHYRVRINESRVWITGNFPTESEAHQAGRAAVEELKAS